MQVYPAPIVAKAVYQKENGVASSVMSLHPNTSTVEIGAFGGQGAVIRWVPLTENAAGITVHASVIASGVAANFDHYIPPSTVRRFVVPKETGGNRGANTQIGSVEGLYQRLAWINAGATASSLISIEY